MKQIVLITDDEGLDQLQAALNPKTPLCVLIDRQDIREEQLPQLMPWDRWRLLAHKKEGLYGYRIFKQEGKSFLQWASIPEHDPLFPLLTSHPRIRALFVPLEAGQFLKAYPSKYNILIYQIGSHKPRYVVFKDKRLLLARSFVGEEDLKTSLHFLNRHHPDIYEGLQVVNLVEGVKLSFPRVITVPDTFLDFLTSRKNGTLSIGPKNRQWMRKMLGLCTVSCFMLAGGLVYQGLQEKNETNRITLKINEIRREILAIKPGNITALRSAIAHHDHLKSQTRTPFSSLEKLADLLSKHPLKLQQLIWNHEKDLSLEISFLIKGESLSDTFNAVLLSLGEAFPKSRVQVLEAPFKSGVHETYEYPLSDPHPMGRIRMVE